MEVYGKGLRMPTFLYGTTGRVRLFFLGCSAKNRAARGLFGNQPGKPALHSFFYVALAHLNIPEHQIGSSDVIAVLTSITKLFFEDHH